MYVFANDTYGHLNDTESMTFFINPSIRDEVIYTGYDGKTTDFDSLNQTELEDIQNMTLEHSDYGKILF